MGFQTSARDTIGVQPKIPAPAEGAGRGSADGGLDAGGARSSARAPSVLCIQVRARRAPAGYRGVLGDRTRSESRAYARSAGHRPSVASHSKVLRLQATSADRQWTRRRSTVCAVITSRPTFRRSLAFTRPQAGYGLAPLITSETHRQERRACPSPAPGRDEIDSG